MFKKLKSLFVIEEGNASQEEKTTTAENTQTSRPEKTVLHKAASVTPVAGVKGQVQDKFLEVLFEALESHNQEGFDYMEFKEFLRSSAKIPMDDSTRFKAAFANAQTMGATKDKILGSAKQYIAILGKEESKFQEALTGQKDRNLTGKQDEIKNLEKTIQANEAEIEKLKAAMENHKKSITTLEGEINTASEKLAQTASDFEATYVALLSQIQDDVKNIESHL